VPVLFDAVVVGDVLDEEEGIDALCVVDDELCEEVEGVELEDVVVKSPAFHRIDNPNALIPPPACNPIGITLAPLVIEAGASELGRSDTSTVQAMVEYCGQLVDVWHE
jgi:hypothetical protein